MKSISRILCLGICLMVLAGCVQREVVMVMPGNNQDTSQLTQPVSKHCFSTDDAGMQTAKLVVGAGVIKSQRAESEHMSGCGAVKFQIGSDGKATNITVLREYPDGYGYGDAVANAIRRSTYTVPANSNDWFFDNETSVYLNQAQQH